MMSPIIKIGTRGSPLALWQAQQVAARLQAAHPDIATELVVIKTTGDRIVDRPLSEVGGKGLFVKEIEEALLGREVDIAVHSMKDMPALLPDGLEIGAVLRREEYRDALVCRDGSWATLKHGAVVGTSSLRRRALARIRRPDLHYEECRGNVDTRLRKLDDGQYDAIVLSAAGLDRLGLASRVSDILDWIPAVGQGIIGIESRRDDMVIKTRLAALHHPQTACELSAERAFMLALDGNCQVAIGCLARLTDESLTIHGFWVNPKTTRYHDHRLEGPAQNAEALGKQLADLIIANATTVPT